MAYKFLTDSDLTYKIRVEISNILKGGEDGNKLEIAENAALAQVKQYIGNRYDCTAIFAATDDNRDAFIIQVVICIMLYQLYGQTGMKDIPTHRKEDYSDVIKWLEEVGRGDRDAVLPSLVTEENPVDIRMNSEDRLEWNY